MNSTHGPFITTLIMTCLESMQDAMKDIADCGPLTHDNIMDMSGHRGHLVGAMAYMLLMKAYYPKVLAGVLGNQTGRVFQYLNATQDQSAAMANRIADMIDRPEYGGFDAPEKPQDPDILRGCVTVLLKTMEGTIAMCRTEIGKEGDLGNKGQLVRTHGANCCLSSALVCIVSAIQTTGLELPEGFDPQTFEQSIRDASDFNQATTQRIAQALSLRPH